MEKNCISCGKKIAGRSDKKFCNETCKNEYHNMQQSQKPAAFKQHRAAARRNRTLLLKMEASGIEKVSTRELEKIGFSFEGFTGIRFDHDESFQLICYEYLLQRNGNLFTIQRAFL